MEIKTETKILKALNKVFNDLENKEEPKEYSVYDKSNVCMITGLSDEAKNLLKRFVKVEDTKKEPTLNYGHEELAVCNYSTEYLNHLLKIFEYDTAIKFTMAKDYPLTIENKDFRVILAPRMNTD